MTPIHEAWSRYSEPGTGEKAFGADGWVTWTNLAPGTRYRVEDGSWGVAKGPAVIATVTTPEENGAVVEVELRLPAKGAAETVAEPSLPVEEE